MKEIPADVGHLSREELKRFIPAVRGILLTTKEVGLILRSSTRWVEKNMADGTFPFRWYLFGPRLRMCDSADLNDWIEKMRIPAATVPDRKQWLENRIRKNLSKKEESAQ
jgi:hypothetical protein